MTSGETFAKRVFQIAGIYGIVVLTPQYLFETGVVPGVPLPIAQPELFYGFIGVALAWQFVFLLIARDVQRYRALMPLGFVEKLVFGVPVMALYAAGRVTIGVVAFGAIDLTLGALFVAAYLRTGAGAGGAGATASS